jgi:hypothetical protein
VKFGWEKIRNGWGLGFGVLKASGSNIDRTATNRMEICEE